MGRGKRAGEPGNGSRDEKLRAIGIFTRIGHAQQAGLAVLQLEILVAKFGSIDGLPTST